MCLSQLLARAAAQSPVLLEPVIDAVFHNLFQQVCNAPPDYEQPGTVRNHNEVLRCYDIMMSHYPARLLGGLLTKAEHSGEEKLRVGALTVTRHLLNLPTEILGPDRLQEVVTSDWLLKLDDGFAFGDCWGLYLRNSMFYDVTGN